MDEYNEVFVGLDTSKLKISVAVADGERTGEVRFLGDISSEPGAVASLVAKLAKAEPSFTSATRPAPQGTTSIARSSGSGMSAWWWLHRWCRSGRATESRPIAATR